MIEKFLMADVAVQTAVLSALALASTASVEDVDDAICAATPATLTVVNALLEEK